jgi:hypothetical protein
MVRTASDIDLLNFLIEVVFCGGISKPSLRSKVKAGQVGQPQEY